MLAATTRVSRGTPEVDRERTTEQILPAAQPEGCLGPSISGDPSGEGTTLQ